MKYCAGQLGFAGVVAATWRIFMKQDMHTIEDMQNLVVQGLIAKAVLAGLEVLYMLHQINKVQDKIFEKCDHLERRTMKAGTGFGDLSRIVGNDLKNYDKTLGGVIWLERCCRSHFEGWSKGQTGSVWLQWTLICSEVCFRECRDFLVGRIAKVEALLKTGAGLQLCIQGCALVASQEGQIMENLQLTSVKFWQPILQIEEWTSMEYNHAQVTSENAVEIVMWHQLLERRTEMKTMMSDMMKKFEDNDGLPWLTMDMPDVVDGWRKEVQEEHQAANGEGKAGSSKKDWEESGDKKGKNK